LFGGMGDNRIAFRSGNSSQHIVDVNDRRVDCQSNKEFNQKHKHQNIVMTQQELDFLEQHKINFESVQLGFTRNIQHDVLAEYERIYKAYLDPQFVLIYYCGACVFDMLKRLGNHYASIKASQETFVFPDDLEKIEGAVMVEMDIPQTKKPSRSKKK
jgi:hypothetical protein